MNNKILRDSRRKLIIYLRSDLRNEYLKVSLLSILHQFDRFISTFWQFPHNNTSRNLQRTIPRLYYFTICKKGSCSIPQSNYEGGKGRRIPVNDPCPPKLPVEKKESHRDFYVKRTAGSKLFDCPSRVAAALSPGRSCPVPLKSQLCEARQAAEKKWGPFSNVSLKNWSFKWLTMGAERIDHRGFIRSSSSTNLLLVFHFFSPSTPPRRARRIVEGVRPFPMERFLPLVNAIQHHENELCASCTFG